MPVEVFQCFVVHTKHKYLTLSSNEIVADTKEGYWALETTVPYPL